MTKRKRKVVLITGGRRGIGLASAQRFANGGWDVALNDIDPGGLAEATHALGATTASVTTHPGDVGDRDVVEAILDEVFAQHGRIDAVVNNAGTIRFARFLDYDSSDFDATFHTNVAGPFHVTQSVARRWVASGSPGCVVMISSASATQARPGHSAYGSSKAALEHLARSVAMELGPYGIRVNCVSPGGPILTEFVEPLTEQEGFLERVATAVPLGRMGEPEEVASVVFFLSGAEASYVNGAVVNVDGGVTLGRP